MSFPDPLAASDGPWDTFLRRAARTREATPSRPSSRQSEISNLSDLTMASELLRSEPASQTQSQPRRDAMEEEPWGVVDIAIPRKVSQHEFFWMRVVAVFAAFLQFLGEAFVVLTRFVHAFLTKARVKTIGSAKSGVAFVYASLTRGWSAHPEASRSAPRSPFTNTITAVSAVVVALHDSIQSKLGWAFILAYSAVPVILLFNHGSESLASARGAICVKSHIPIFCGDLNRRGDANLASFSSYDASKDPQTLVFQQSNELDRVLQSSMSSTDLWGTLSASSDAFRVIARQVDSARLPASDALVENMLQYGTDVVQAVFRLTDFDQSIRDGSSSLTALSRTLSQRLEGEGRRASRSTGLFGFRTRLDTNNTQIQVLASDAYSQLCEGFVRQGSRILAEAYRTRESLVELRRLLLIIEDQVWSHKSHLGRSQENINRELLVKLGLKDNQSTKFELYRDILRRSNQIQSEAWAYISAMIHSLERGYLSLDHARYQCRPAKLAALGGGPNIPLEQHLQNLKSAVQPFQRATSRTEWGKVVEKIIKDNPTL